MSLRVYFLRMYILSVYIRSTREDFRFCKYACRCGFAKTWLLWWGEKRMPRIRPGWWQRWRSKRYQRRSWNWWPSEGMKSELRCLFGGAEFVCFGFQPRRALIGTSSPVSSPSSSSNYILFSPVPFLILRLFAFLFLFWLGCAVDHRPHTPTTNPFQYSFDID